MKTLCAVVLFAVLALTGCAGGPSACVAGTSVVYPATVTLDHLAAPPANQQQFTVSVVGGTCPEPQNVALGPITSSDPVNAPSSPTGLIACLGTTTVPVVLSSPLASRTATLTCK